MNQFMLGIAVTASAAVGLVFLKSWRRTRDRLFIIFALAFWLLCLNWLLVAITCEPEYRAAFYVARLLAFALILGGIIDKNRVRQAN